MSDLDRNDEGDELPPLEALPIIAASEFRANLKEHLDRVCESGEMIRVERRDGVGAIVIDERVYVDLRRAAAAQRGAYQRRGFRSCVDDAVALFAGDLLTDAALRDDFDEFESRCRRGVAANHAALDAPTFMTQVLWTIGSTQKRFHVRMRYWEAQQALFRAGNPNAIRDEAADIRAEWAKSKSYLSPKQFEAVLAIGCTVAETTWEQFKQEYLLLPEYPASESCAAWSEAHWALRELPQVGYAISYYLLRNLYGAPFVKPDVHILAIANRYFGDEVDPLAALQADLHDCWDLAAARLPRLRPLHMGTADYVLWWYRQRTGLPA
jgi:hypothetical protein